MKKERIFTANIMVCNNLEEYNNSNENSVSIYESCAKIIKTRNNKYILINRIETFSDELKCNLGIKVGILDTYPSRRNIYFVDEKSLRPYFNDYSIKKCSHITVKKLRLQIEHDRLMTERNQILNNKYKKFS